MHTTVAIGSVVDADVFRSTIERCARRLSHDGCLVGITAGVTAEGVGLVVLSTIEAPPSSWSGAVHDVLQQPALLTASRVAAFDHPSADAGFIQVILGAATDPARVQEIENAVLPGIHAARADVLGSVSIWCSQQLVELAYFVSEGDARVGERQPLTAEQQSAFAEWQQQLPDRTHLDLRTPFALGRQHW